MKLNITNIAFALLLLAAGTGARAQDSTNNGNPRTVTITHSSGYKTTSLRLGSAIGYGLYRDMGTAPISFKGVALQPVVGLEFGGMRKWTTTIDAFSSVGVFEDAVAPKLNFGSFDISNTLRFKMRRCIEEWHYAALSAGFGAANFLDVTVNPDYENAAAGISEFFGPELSLRADWFLNTAFGIYNADKPQLQLHTELGLMPLAAILRPGYAYIDNYTASQPVLAALFDNYQWHLKPLAALYTDIGLDILTGSFSRISFSYLWSYHSSGNSGASRFDHATHYLAIDFIIPLKSKRICLSKITSAD